MLPIEDHDHLLLGELRTRLRNLSTDAIEELLTHEQRHAARPAVLDLLQQRLNHPGGATGSDGPAEGLALQDRSVNPEHRDTALGVEGRIAHPPKAPR